MRTLFILSSFIAIAGALFLVWRSAGGVVLRTIHARPIHFEDAPWLHEAAQALCRATGVRSLRLFSVEERTANGFALCVGRGHAVVLTSGALKTLSAEELRAIIAHELAHVAFGHTRRATFAAFVVALLARLHLGPRVRGLLHGWFYRVGTPLSRELAADRRAAELLGDARLLRATLRRLSASQRRARRPVLADVGMPFTASPELRGALTRRLRALRRQAARQRRDAALGLYVRRRRRRRSKFFPRSSGAGRSQEGAPPWRSRRRTAIRRTPRRFRPAREARVSA